MASDPSIPHPNQTPSSTWLDRAIARNQPTLRPADPASTLALEAPGLWSHERSFGAPLAPRIPTRMAVVKLGSGALWVWSPLPPEGTLCRELAALGPVAAVVAPSTFHHLFAGDFARAVEARELWLAPGLRDKRPDLDFGHTLDANATPSFGDEFSFTVVGPLGSFCELLLFHEPTGTLFVADLGFHLTHLPRLIDRAFWRLYGSYGAFGPSHLTRAFLRRDRAAVARSLDVAACWPINRIFVAHGESVTHEAKETFRQSYAAWLSPTSA